MRTRRKKPGMAEFNKKNGTSFKRGQTVMMEDPTSDKPGRVAGVITGTSCEYWTAVRQWGPVRIMVRFPGHKHSMGFTASEIMEED